MKNFFRLKLLMGLLIAVAAYLPATVMMVGLGLLFGDFGKSIATYAIYVFDVGAAILVTIAFLATYTAPNLAWLMTLRASKTKIWALNYLTSIAVWLMVTLSLAAVAFTVDRFDSDLHLLNGWQALGVSLLAMGRLWLTPTEVPARTAIGGVLYLAFIQFSASMIDLKPGRAARYTIGYFLLWTAVIILITTVLQSMAIFFIVFMTAIFSFQAGHARARLEMTWRQFAQIGACLATAWVLLAAIPCYSTFRGLRSMKVEVVRDAHENAGAMSTLDDEHVMKLLATPLEDEWDLNWLLWRLDGSDGKLDPRRPGFDLKTTVLAQDDLDVLTMLAINLSNDATVQDIETIIDHAETLPTITDSNIGDSGQHAAEPTFAAAILRLKGDGTVADRFLRAPGARKRATGLILARYFPSPVRFEASRQIFSKLPQDLGRIALATASVLSGGLVRAADLDAAVFLADTSALCAGLDRYGLCAYNQACSGPNMKMECITNRVGSDVRLNACLRRAIESYGPAVVDLERHGWLSDRTPSSRDAFAKALACHEISR